MVRYEQQTGYLQCPLPEGGPQPVISWEANGQSIDFSNPRFNLLSNQHALQIKNMTIDDAGAYYCYAKNMAGTVKSLLFNVTVLREYSSVCS